MKRFSELKKLAILNQGPLHCESCVSTTRPTFLTSKPVHNAYIRLYTQVLSRAACHKWDVLWWRYIGTVFIRLPYHAYALCTQLWHDVEGFFYSLSSCSRIVKQQTREDQGILKEISPKKLTKKTVFNASIKQMCIL